jgi:hypothetical protein
MRLIFCKRGSLVLEEQADVILIQTGAALMYCYSFRFSIYQLLFQVLYIILFMIEYHFVV